MDNSPLAKLPPELRNRIYEEVLVSPEPLCLEEHGPQRTHLSPRLSKEKTPTLVLVCRTIYTEANPYLYLDNVFAAPDCETLYIVLSQIGKQNAQSLRRLVCDRGIYYGRCITSWLAEDLETCANEGWSELRALMQCIVCLEFTLEEARTSLEPCGLRISLDFGKVRDSWTLALPEIMCEMERIRGRLSLYQRIELDVEVERLQKGQSKDDMLEKSLQLFD